MYIQKPSAIQQRGGPSFVADYANGKHPMDSEWPPASNAMGESSSGKQINGRGIQESPKSIMVAKMEDEVMDECDASQVTTSCSPAEQMQVGEEGAAIRRSKIPVPISEALMEFFGIKENRMLEREAVVGVWDYILDKDLVATDENGDEPLGTVYGDEKLKKLFKIDTFHGLELLLHVIKHLLKRALED
ncbi:hypothetical protein RHSIM_Rhsim12G0062500 [Rhododendron simsii]|uniref:DM2 domain-containing protein n=1 Tax=Rhododendron simsii TaxID=118357 RepID=A0A834L985_RHOSS|nr:hypothetical protein RHSIM_Rhsim12G0062500 [Rhododendron simsii]